MTVTLSMALFSPMRILLLLLLTVCAFAEEVPQWVLRGIAGVESSSYYDDHGLFVYVNQKRGRHGELGPWQMTRATFRCTTGNTVGFERLRTDTAFAEAVAQQRLLQLRSQLGSWDAAVRAWNAGLTGAKRGRGSDYLRDVKRWVKKFEPEYAP